MSKYLVYLLGAGFGSCLLWWPICFVAARNSFKFEYKWYFFLIGYFFASIISSVAIHLVSIGVEVSEDYQSLITVIGVPVAASLIVILSFSLVIKSQKTLPIINVVKEGVPNDSTSSNNSAKPNKPKYGWFRLAIVTSVIWFIGSLSLIEPWKTTTRGARDETQWDDWLLYGLLPLVIIWGIYWAILGFKKK